MEILIILLILAAVVGGYFFLKKYDRIDKYLFSSVENYKPFGLKIVYISAIAGAVFGCIFMYSELSDTELNLKPIYLMAYTIFVYILSMSIYQTILTLDSVGAIIGKSLWMLLSCALAAVIGFAGSIVIICIIILYLVIAVLGGMIFGSGKKTKIRESDGTEHTVQDMGMFGNIDESGNTWTNKGFGEYEKDN